MLLQDVAGISFPGLNAYCMKRIVPSQTASAQARQCRRAQESGTQRKEIVMKMFRIWLFAGLLMFSKSVCADGSGATSIEALSAWTNQSGSTLYIDAIAPNGQVSGHYINRAQGYGCQNIAYPMTGWLYANSITFTVKWQSTTQSCNSITSWTGFFYGGKINTLWQLVVNGSTSTSQILKGSDTFTPTTVLEMKSLVPDK
jgi:Avidin family